jgi:hypothetical protein
VIWLCKKCGHRHGGGIITEIPRGWTWVLLYAGPRVACPRSMLPERYETRCGECTEREHRPTKVGEDRPEARERGPLPW